MKRALLANVLVSGILGRVRVLTTTFLVAMLGCVAEVEPEPDPPPSQPSKSEDAGSIARDLCKEPPPEDCQCQTPRIIAIMYREGCELTDQFAGCARLYCNALWGL